MKFHDPERQRIGDASDGAVCWESAYVAIPGLYVEPSTAGDSFCSIGVVINGSWCYITMSISLLPMLLTAWSDDPEAALRSYFEVDPPSGARQRSIEPAVNVSTNKSIDELGL
jgi:hypothetical protein